jgi:hypothetical protein
MTAGPKHYWLTRWLFLRLLGLVYVFAFLCTLNQSLPLIGAHGLLPAQAFLARVSEAMGSGASAFWRVPTLFWLDCSDTTLRCAAWAGLVLSIALLLGWGSTVVVTILWALYMSFVHVGQIFYGYGWETLLLETSVLAMFLCPLVKGRAFDPASPPPTPVVWMLRWLAFRMMFGAGLIKIRGDQCWRDFTCMLYHYQTQPIPNPMSPWLHHLPPWFHTGEVVFNHFVELIVPWFVFGPRPLRHAAGVFLVLFQVLLIVSGNLSFLNWLTITVCIACFDDGLLARVLPRRLRERVPAEAPEWDASRPRFVAVVVLGIVVGLLSLNPIANMLSPGQAMNASFDPFDLVNTYGAFGTVGRERPEIVIEGTDDPPDSPTARWRPYEFPCKPGELMRRPCITSPYHRRLDWQMWFAAMSQAEDEPWFIHMIAKLLQGDRPLLTLFASVPFPDHPPRAVRALLYRYEFVPPGDRSGAWWRRTLLGVYVPPLTADDPRLVAYLHLFGWPER